MSKIDFVGIGAHKCGSTWLYERLAELDDFGMPPIKELHYFDCSGGSYRQTHYVAKSILRDRIKDIAWLKSSISSCAASAKNLRWNELKWKLNWYFSNYNDAWYLNLFNGLKGISGDISPGYALLDSSDIERVKKIAPDAKIIYLLRNPVERAWSHYRFRTRKHSVEDIKSFINSTGQVVRSDYLGTIDRYTKVFGPNRMILGFYDAIGEQPLALLTEIVDFLGGDATNVSRYCDLTERNKVSRSQQITPEIESFLREKYQPLIDELATRFGGYCHRWRSQDIGKLRTNELPRPTMII